ncbi:MAG TPA: HAMP domain-containing sensor histidine kinase, partial [Atribacter sp.]|uniref:sensor histidine kinase n=1 Tax=Atribacter sp. TaxID=2847780 RepID=UPI002CE7C11D
IATQLFIFSLWIFLLVRAFISGSIIDQLVNWGSFIGTVVIGTFLIRSVLKEVSQREKIEKLAEDLGKANERLKELDKQKTEFVSIASHQLRSPLTAIKGYSSMLLEGSFGPVPKKAKEAIDVIFQSSQKMISVIEDFLNITRIELGRMKYEMSDIDVGALAKQVTEEQRPQVVKNGLKLEFEDDGHDHNVYTDMGKLNQVFNNIIDNAGKYTKEGWIRVRVENLTKPEGEEVVRFVVKDSGVGIPPETLPKLFEKFVRAYDAGKVNLIGTGLGLYAAKQIVEGLGGKIWAESEGKGKGSTFIVEFKHTKPLAEQEKEKKVVEFVEGI